MNTPDDHSLVAVTVRRTGGLAGITRQWATQVDPADDRLPELVRRCPWQEVPREHVPGADRFVWVLTARWEPGLEREATLDEQAAVGPWRALIDAVRDAAGH